MPERDPHVVLVAPDFPPSSRPPALRNRLFARHLPSLGWRTTVLTVDPRHYTWPTDPPGARVDTLGAEVRRVSAISRTLTSPLGINDIGIRALWHLWGGLRGICARQHVDAIVLSIPPNVTSMLGPLAHEVFGIPYVLDYQDPWIADEYRAVPSSERPGGAKWRLADGLARWLEPLVLSRVGHISGVSQATIDRVVQRYPGMRSVGTTEIPFGFELADLQSVLRHPRPNPVFDPGDGNVHISYIGAFTPSMRPAAAAVLAAVAAVRAAEPRKVRNLRLHFVGTTYGPPDGQHFAWPMAKALGLGDLVDEMPERIPYLDALQVMLHSQALLLIGTDAPHYTASKLFPLALSGRPILAVVHEASSAVSLLSQVPTARIITFLPGDPDRRPDAARIRAELEGILERPAEPAPQAPELPPSLSARAMTERLADALCSVVGSREGAPPTGGP